jgi:hypothetical protein
MAYDEPRFASSVPVTTSPVAGLKAFPGEELLRPSKGSLTADCREDPLQHDVAYAAGYHQPGSLQLSPWGEGMKNLLLSA